MSEHRQLDNRDWLFANRQRTTAELAAEFGCSKRRVADAYRSAGITRSKPPVPALRDEDWLRDHAEATVAEIAEQLGCSRVAVYDAYKRAGIRRRRQPTGPRPTRSHGTLAAYRRHFRRGEEPCSLCRAAHREYQAQRRQRHALHRPVRQPPPPIRAELADAEWLAARVAEGWSDRRIGEHLGVVTATVYRWRHRHGIGLIAVSTAKISVAPS
jgi:hypothetical protein